MLPAVVFSRAQVGIDAPLVTVEVHITGGLPSLNIVGLPETAVRESKDRVRSAIMNGSFEFPTRRITVNLAPADLPKEGGRFDLPIAVGILAASNQLDRETLGRFEFLGELALTGALRSIRGALPAAISLKATDRELVLPRENAAEAALVQNVCVRPASSLLEVCAHLTRQTLIKAHDEVTPDIDGEWSAEDLADVRGQQFAKRGLEIAAAGAHHILLCGPPGTGKSMLSRRLVGILPPLSEEEALSTAAIRSLSTQGFDPEHWGRRPFRAPHHTASAPALVGGGGRPRPGEISLAHNGVLFLDELPEFERRVLEALREPLEAGYVTISRATHQTVFPARFQFIASMNPCPCGWFGDSDGRCRCTAEQIQRYRSRISGPLLDRIDLHIEVQRLGSELFIGRPSGAESSRVVRERVMLARERQLARSGKLNSALLPSEVERDCALDDAARTLLETAVEKLGLSARGWQRVIKVARTICDLANEDSMTIQHLSEAISYRNLDRPMSTQPG
jgi:magnesium chelatase family protein